ncbi:Plasma membrane proteolipid 3 [Escovopsis weberi]|uniref:Plasma membrane proteolipid 3 n=1 Tax=Escovopsis weberi TaxID=150374 RepID=A0A0M9VV29_ESCWE|nr:Plasma membrane proteolipid 3 [Escovopsis weberi]
MCTNDIFLGVLAVLFPPLPVWVKSGLCSADALINILLCLLGYLPGLLHAWYIIAKHPDPPYDYQYDHQHQHQHAYSYEPVPAPARPPHDARVAYEYVYVRSPPPQGGMHYPPAGAASPHQGHHQQQQQQSYPHQGYHQQQQQQQQQQHEYSQQQQHHHVQDGMNYGTAGAWSQQHHDGQGYGEGGSNAPPPPYTPLPGDHKIQTRD